MGARLKKDRLHSGLYGYGTFSPGRREGGFTMVELLIAMAVASIVAMSGFALFSQSNWSYQVQENVGEAQQNARVAMDRIVRDIRTAGFGLPKTSYTISFPDGAGTIDFDSPITVSDSSTGPDTITILGIGFEAGDLVPVAENQNKKGDSYICYSPTTSAEKILNADGSIDDTRKYVNVDGTFYATLKTGEPLEACGSGKKLYLDSPPNLKADFNSGTVYIIQAVEYSIATDLTGCSAANPCLASEDFSALRGTGRQLLAENIEDIQFAYGLDDGDDGVLDSAIDCATGASATLGFKCSPLSTEEDDIRAVRVTLSARTRNKDPKGATFTRPAIENHPESDPPDNYRRRVLTKVVKLRN